MSLHPKKWGFQAKQGKDWAKETQTRGRATENMKSLNAWLSLV